MNAQWIASLNSLADTWLGWMWPMAWQFTILVMVVASLAWLLRGRSARLQYAVWLLVPLRLLLPPTLALATGWGWWLLPAAQTEEVAIAPRPSSSAAGEPATRHADFEASHVPSAPRANEFQVIDLVPQRNAGLSAANATSRVRDAQPITAIAAPPPAARPTIPWQTWLFCGWAVGVAILAARLIHGCVRASQMVRRAGIIPQPIAGGGVREARGADGADVLALVENCQRRLGLRRRVGVRELADAGPPMLVGILRPTILLPTGLQNRLTRPELEAVLTHELQHVARFDALVQLVQALLGVVYFFHPLVWMANRAIGRLREEACDEATVAALEGRRIEYGTSIVKVATMMTCRAPRMSLGVVESESHVKHRLQRILDPRLPIGRRLSWSTLALLLLLAAIVLPAAARPGIAAPDDSSQVPAAAAANSAEPKAAESKAATATAESTAKPKASEPAEPRITLRGTVLDENGAAFEGAVVSVDWFKKGRAETRTDQQGRFELVMSDKALIGSMVRVLADSGKRQAHYRLSKETRLDDVQLKLTPARRVELKVVDGAGRPIGDAHAGVQADYPVLGKGRTDADGAVSFLVPSDVPVAYVYALSAGHGLDYRAYVVPRDRLDDKSVKPPKPPDGPIQLTLDGVKPLSVRTVTADNKPLAGIKVYPWYVQKPDQPENLNLSYFTEDVQGTTDQEGRVTFDWIPNWQEDVITVWTTPDDYPHQRGSYDPKTDDGKLTIEHERLVPIRGLAKLPDGKAAADVNIVVIGKGYDIDGFHGTVKTDADGRYELKVAPNMVYLVVVQDNKWGAEARTGFAVWPNTPVENLAFALRPATRIFGRVTLGPDQTPIKGQRIYVRQDGQDAHNLKGVELPNPKKSQLWVQPSHAQHTTTDEDGRFELFVGAGKFDIGGPSQVKSTKFEITDQREHEVNFHAARPETGILRGLVVTGDPQRGVEEAEVFGIYRNPSAPRDLRATTDAGGKFEVERGLHRTVVHARSKDRTSAGVVQIEPDDPTVTVVLRPLATAKGRLLDAKSNQPLADREIVYGVRVHIGDDKAPWQTSFGGSTKTDAGGAFEIKNLILDQPYEIDVTIPGEDNPANVTWQGIGKLRPEEAKQYALGDLRLSPPYKAPTLEERIAAAFESRKKPLERFESAKEDAELSRQRVLILFGSPAGDVTKQFMKLRFDDQNVRRALDSFELIAVNTADEKLADAKLLAATVSHELDATRRAFSLVVADDEGKPLGSVAAEALEQNGEFSQEKLLEFLKSQTLTPLDARQLLNEALAQAKAQNKRVIIQESATWCGPCHQLSQFLDRNRDKWEKDYIWVKIDQRWTGAIEMMKEYRQKASGGIPWWAILDADGKTLITSNEPEGDNIGFPSSDSGRAHFRTMLERTAVRLTAAEISTLVEATRGGK